MCCCLVFDARDIKFNPNGYEYPSHTQAAPPTGIETFPAVLSIPAVILYTMFMFSCLLNLFMAN